MRTSPHQTTKHHTDHIRTLIEPQHQNPPRGFSRERPLPRRHTERGRTTGTSKTGSVVAEKGTAHTAPYIRCDPHPLSLGVEGPLSTPFGGVSKYE